VAAVGIATIVGLVAALVVVVAGGDDGTGGGAGGSGSSTSLPPADEAELRQVVDEISTAVEDERGLEFERQVDVELADDDEFAQRLLDDFEEDEEEIRRTEALLEGFGLADPDGDLVASLRSLLEAAVVGFYDPETDELVVRGTALTPYVRTTIAHELTHALDDQHFDLDRPEYDDADDEIGFGFSAVVEGNARRIETAYLDTFSASDREAVADEELAIGLGADLSDVPFVLVELLDAPYSHGLELVTALLDAGGQAQLDEALAEPPRTSEQVLDPDAFLAGEDRVAVPHPEVAGEVVDEVVAGQLVVELVLADELDRESARQAAEGWGGDWVVTWRDGDRSCVTLTVVGDTRDDTGELADAFDEWAAAQQDATVTTTAGAGPVTVEACAG
jgi:hypothetical protein